MLPTKPNPQKFHSICCELLKCTSDIKNTVPFAIKKYPKVKSLAGICLTIRAYLVHTAKVAQVIGTHNDIVIA